ncbi:hypothetical protein [Streptomyces sp. ITFR-16]|uniref:hypothetical protein n=1 Tax=Streptomyces sp. ITFR-16 TaxID=3075198 RepID=UPI00288BA32A|nr:hypothetical protein [Streptomyces sp. ITFR-16]WNI25783.1 hypothetical protein RLT58_29605 [Streptomyces sp. ITFR-16]
MFAINGQGRHDEAEERVREALAAYREPDRMRLVLCLGLARPVRRCLNRLDIAFA